MAVSTIKADTRGYHIETISKTINAPASQGFSQGVAIPTISGMTPIAIAGFEIQQWQVAVCACFVASSSEVRFTARNTTSSAVNATTQLKVLYVSEDFNQV